MHLDVLLRAIGSREETSFGELCNALGDERPAKGDKDGWRELFQLIRKAETEGLVEVYRGPGDNFEAAILTEAGAAKARGE